MALKQNIIYIYFKGKHQVTSKSQYQYNRGQYLYFADLNLPQAFEVHFSNKDKGESKTQIGSDNLVEIPDEYFWNGALQIYAWIYLHSKTTDGETIYEVRIPLTKRAKPTDEEPLPVQQSTIDRAIAELNNAVDITTENANKTDSDKIIVSNIKEDVITLKENIDSTATIINQKAQETIDASERAEISAQNAATSENKALNYSQQAEQSAQSALESKNIAQQKSEVATNASNEALGYRDEALEAKNQAVQAKQNIVDYRDETKGYRDETLNLKNNVQTLKNQIDETAEEIEDISDSVKEDAQSASQSASSASQSANSASQSANQAEQYKNQSETNVTHYPKVVDGYWYVWDASNAEYVNTNVDARGIKGDKGDTGETGVGIESTVLNSDYTLTITFTDDTSYTTPSIRGEKGIKGDIGNGIASTVLNNDYTLTINFTDGTQYTTPPIRGIRGAQGIKGDKGDKGDTGATGARGEQGIQGIQGEKGEKGDKGDKGDKGEQGDDYVLTEQDKQDIADIAEADLTPTILNAFPTDIASGSIASFSDGADNLPLKSLVVDINPIQDLHGQENPYPAGGGVNKFKYNASVGTQIINGVTWTLYEDGSIQVSGTASSASTFRYVLSERVEDDDFYFSGNYKFYAFPANISTADFQGGIKIGSKWYSVYADGYSRALNDADGKIVEAWFQVRVDKTVNATIRPMIYPESESTPTAWSPYANICPISGWTEVAVNHSDADMTNPTTLTISLGQTVYGGKLDVLSGELTIDRAIAVFDGTETYNNNYFPIVVCNKTFTKGDASGNSFVNSHLPSLNAACNYASSTKQTFQFGKVNEYWGVSSADELKAIFAQQYANGTPVTICYPLATPIEIQLSANQINSLYGVNNLWADSGDTEVEYRADTKAWIQRKIAEAIASLT